MIMCFVIRIMETGYFAQVWGGQKRLGWASPLSRSYYSCRFITVFDLGRRSSFGWIMGRRKTLSSAISRPVQMCQWQKCYHAFLMFTLWDIKRFGVLPSGATCWPMKKPNLFPWWALFFFFTFRELKKIAESGGLLGMVPFQSPFPSLNAVLSVEFQQPASGNSNLLLEWQFLAGWHSEGAF